MAAPAGRRRPTLSVDTQLPRPASRARIIASARSATWSLAKIARTLFLSPKTVANNVSAIFAKLQVADRAEAMIRAREAGLGT